MFYTAEASPLPENSSTHTRNQPRNMSSSAKVLLKKKTKAKGPEEELETRGSKSVDLDILFGKRVLAHLVASFIGKEVHNLCAMIALKLDHLPHVLILNDGAIASIFLLESFQESFRIVLFGQPLDSRQGLATVALLDANMDVILGLSITNVVGERIINLEIFDGHKQTSRGVGYGGKLYLGASER